ncbi:MAG: hypothetical protein D6690_14370 [Nitrospirae bacterium]|nr:MAG: hypothetical protein D6690_14370 [Nitrospirota bacterium]
MQASKVRAITYSPPLHGSLHINFLILQDLCIVRFSDSQNNQPTCTEKCVSNRMILYLFR